MTNLEKIREAWRIGWAAVVQRPHENDGHIVEYIVLTLGDKGVFIRERNYSPTSLILFLDQKYLDSHLNAVIGYKYAGELAGKEEPRDGQKFLSKLTGLTYEYQGRGIKTDFSTIVWDNVDKFKWQPFFD